MRLLPYIRLSVLNDQSTSPERQFGKIATFARLRSHELVPITAADYDLGVSGSVNPFVRPGLGPWLEDGRINQWDALCVATLDRLTRSLFDFMKLLPWLDSRGKTLVCLDPMLDMSTPEGRASASVIMSFAQFEQETIAARFRDAYDKLVRDGQYAGGQVPFGYRPVKLGRGWGYEPDPEYQPVVAEMFDRYVGHQGFGAIARWLNATGVPTPWDATRKRNGKPLQDALWKATSVRKILGSRAALGAAVTTSGELVRDENGVAVCRATALVSRDIFERAQARIRASPVSAKVNYWPLTQVAFCADCAAPMYGSTAKYGEKKYRYYCCVHSTRRDGVCTARRVNAKHLEAAISRELCSRMGDFQFKEGRLIPNREYSEEITRVADQIGHLCSQIQVESLSGLDVRKKQSMLKRAQEELAHAHALQAAAARAEPMKIGRTFRQHWETLDAHDRSEFLRLAKVRAIVGRDELPSIASQGPLAPFEVPRVAIIDEPKLHVVIHLGSLADMLSPTSAA